jgi:HEAT repeat protein
MRALQQLGPLGASAKDALLAALEAIPDGEEHTRREVLATLAAVAPDARTEVPALAEFLAERDAAEAPVDVRRQDEITKLLPRLRDADPETRMHALGALASMRAVEAVANLVPWLAADRPAAERAAAVQALTALDAIQIVPRCRELLADRDESVRHAAAHALAMFGDTQSFARVAEVLTEHIADANSDELWYLGLTGVTALAPALERIVADTSAPTRRRWGATQALAYVGNAAVAKPIAAMVAEVAADTRLADGERQQLIAVALRVLATLDAPGHRELFAAHRDADEKEVRDAALGGLAAGGDATARAELQRGGGTAGGRLDVDEAWGVRLAAVHLRLSEVRGNSVRDVLARLGKALGVPITASKAAAVVLDRRVGAMYSELVGYRPDGAAVLGLCTSQFFVGLDLVPRCHADRIELLTAEEAGERKR